MSNQAKDTEMIRGYAEKLSEHFDTVQIFVTRHDPGNDNGGTVSGNWGVGCWPARYGQIREWIVMIEERFREHVRKEERGEK